MNPLIAALFLLQTSAEPTLAIEHVAMIPMDREVVLADQTDGRGARHSGRAAGRKPTLGGTAR